MIGELYVEIDDPKKAEEFFKKAEAQAKQIDAQPELASACYNLGMLYKNDNKKNKAREYLRKAEEFYRRIDTPEYKQVQQELLSLDAS
jgi:tetratricopeptide (TPR) repeat protein